MAESPAGAGVYLNEEDAKRLQQGVATINSILSTNSADNEIPGELVVC